LTISFRFCKVLEFKNTKGYFRPLQLTIEGTEEEAECKYIRSNIDDLVFDRSELETNPVNIGSSPNYCVNSPLIDNMDLMT